MFYYTYESGSYYLKEELQLKTPLSNDIIFMTDEVAILFDAESFTLMKHGRPETVQEWYNDAKAKCEGKQDVYDLLIKPLVMLIGKFDVDELNKVINNSGYVERFYRELMGAAMQEEII